MCYFLVPYDGSEAALRALQHAIGQVKLGGAVSIHLVNAQLKAILPADVAVHITPERVEELQRLQFDAVLSPAEDALKKTNLPYSKEILIGTIPEVIAKRAQQDGCNGIIMGTRGMSAINNLVLGSVATRVIHLAKVPVTLVK